MPPDCAARVGYHNETLNESNIPTEDTIDHISIITNTRTHNESQIQNNDEDLDHRLPSPEEQCQIIASKYEVFLFAFIIKLFHISLHFISLLFYASHHDEYTIFSMLFHDDVDDNVIFIKIFIHNIYFEFI